MGSERCKRDRRLTARSGRTHTKLFQAERERLTLIVADTSPLLYFGTRVRFKSVQAARAGALAAWLAARDGDRIAALRGSSREAPVPPASGPRGALRVLDALVRWYAQPPAGDDGLPTALDHARRLLRHGSRLLVLDDPASIAAVPSALWPQLSMHHELGVLLLPDARLQAGVQIVMEAVKLAEKVQDADLVITGEGRMDAQSVHGKTPIGVAHTAKAFGKPVIAIVGCSMLVAGHMTVGVFQAFFQFIYEASEPMTQLSFTFNSLQSALASAERVFDLRDEPGMEADPRPG